MNYDWQQKFTTGQKPIGYLEIYETKANGINIRAIINYFPNLNQFSNNKICSVNITYASKKEDITDGFFHWINDDIIDLIKEKENTFFEPSMEKFKLMMTQQFFVSILQEIAYFTHGDYSDTN